jgi:hypothetical protein
MQDRDLILGVLATQMRFVTPTQVMEAAAARLIDKDSLSLLARLEKSGALTSEQRALLEATADAALAASDGKPDEVLASLGRPTVVSQTLGTGESPEQAVRASVPAAPGIFREGWPKHSIDGDDLANLQPATDDMVALTDPARLVVEATEQTPEQEQVSGAHSVSIQMCLRDLVLPESWLPSRDSRPHLRSKIRVEVSPSGPAYFALCESLDELPEITASPTQVVVPDRRTLVRNRHREHRAVGEDRAGAAATSRVEAFPAQDDPHSPCSIARPRRAPCSADSRTSTDTSPRQG